jgi:hypothetical protein
MSIRLTKQEIERTREEIHTLEVKLAILQTNLKVYEAITPHPVGTKIKWTKDADNYRVAVQTKEGLLEVKVVKNGVADYHQNCNCIRCIEIHLSNGKVPPWRKSPPLTTTLFENEFHWHDSFDGAGGKIVVISAPLPKEIRALTLIPLEATTDALKLKELEERFPDAIFTLIIPPKQYDITYTLNGMYHQISCEQADMCVNYFSDFGKDAELLISWRGYVFDMQNVM